MAYPSLGFESAMCYTRTAWSMEHTVNNGDVLARLNDKITALYSSSDSLAGLLIALTLRVNMSSSFSRLTHKPAANHALLGACLIGAWTLGDIVSKSTHSGCISPSLFVSIEYST
jgi:hypothetical protein